MAEKKGILDQLLEEAMAKGAQSAAAEDFAVNLSTTDSDGTHQIEGIPMSKVGKSFLARFGIESSDDGQGDGGQGDGGQGQGGGQGKPNVVPTLFPRKKAAGQQ